MLDMNSSESAVYCCSLAGRLCPHPINPSDQVIRVLDIEPASSSEDPIICSTRIISLESDENYQTLSYCWGEPVLDASVICNRVTLPVTSHLEAGLRRIRDLKLPNSGTIWVDAICINQEDDPDEKSAQVRLMAKIYRQSSRLLIWLGETGVDETAILREAVSRAHAIKGSPEAVSKMLQSPWLMRRWVVQEVLLSAEGRRHFLYGNERFLFDHIVSLRRSHPLSLPPMGIDSSTSGQLLDLGTQNERHAWRPGEPEHRIPSLIDCLYIFRYTRCSRYVDLIYSLLGISGDQDQLKETLTINYTMSKRVLSQQLASIYLRHAQPGSNRGSYGVQILVWATCTNNTNLDWPSWVPDWSMACSYVSDRHKHSCDTALRERRSFAVFTPISVKGDRIYLPGILFTSCSDSEQCRTCLRCTLAVHQEDMIRDGWPHLERTAEVLYMPPWGLFFEVIDGVAVDTYRLRSCFSVKRRHAPTWTTWLRGIEKTITIV